MIKIIKTNHNVVAESDTPFMTPTDLNEVTIALPRHYNIGNITYTPATGNGTTATITIECECITQSYE